MKKPKFVPPNDPKRPSFPPQRLMGESFEQYKGRRALQNLMVKRINQYAPGRAGQFKHAGLRKRTSNDTWGPA